MVKRSYDDRTGILSVVSAGYWSVSDVERHFEKLRAAIDALRDLGKPVRVLSDATRAPRQPAATEEAVLKEMRRTFSPGDRVAILAANMQDHAYTKSAMGPTDIGIFFDRQNAVTWLLMDESANAI
jgi:hypothetical protein